MGLFVFQPVTVKLSNDSVQIYVITDKNKPELTVIGRLQESENAKKD